MMLAMALNSNGQSLEDKLYVVKYFLSGQGLSMVVLKATTSEILGPKKKHLDYLVNITNEPNVSIPSLVKYLMRRTKHPEWSVAFKALITLHHLMSHGNDRFVQNLASSYVNVFSFDTMGSSFVDRTTQKGFYMSTFVRRYARYMSVKVQTYRALGVDFCKAKSGSQSVNKMKDLQHDQLMKTIDALRNQIDALFAFDASASDLNNGIINSAFLTLYKDFVKLYIAYQAAIIRLLELFTRTNKLRKAQEQLVAYKKFLVRMEKVTDFTRVLDSVGISKEDMPSMERIPTSVPLASLEARLRALEHNIQVNISGNTSSHAKQRTLDKMRSLESTPLKQPFQDTAKAPTTPVNLRLDYALPPANFPSRRRSLRNQRSLASSSSISKTGPEGNSNKQPVGNEQSATASTQEELKLAFGDSSAMRRPVGDKLSKFKLFNEPMDEFDGDLLLFDEEEEERQRRDEEAKQNQDESSEPKKVRAESESDRCDQEDNSRKNVPAPNQSKLDDSDAVEVVNLRSPNGESPRPARDLMHLVEVG